MQHSVEETQRNTLLFMSSLKRTTSNVNSYTVDFPEITNVHSISVECVYLPKTPGLLQKGVIFLHLDNGQIPAHFYSESFKNRLTFPLFLEDLSTSEFFIGKSRHEMGTELQYKRDFRQIKVSFTDHNGDLIDFGEANGSVVDTEQTYVYLTLKSHPPEY